MKTAIATLSVLATLVAGLVATPAAAATCDLPVMGEGHVLRVLESDDFVGGTPGAIATHGLNAEEIEIVPGLGDPTKVSLRSVTNPNHYFVVNLTNGDIELWPYACTADFFLRATFDMTPGTSTGLCNYSGVSFEWVGYAGYFITAHGGTLSVEPEIISHANGLTDDTQTFAVDWEEDSSPICE